MTKVSRRHLPWRPALALVLLALAAACGPPAGSLAITNVSVVDIEADSVVPGRTVLIRDGHIIRVGAADEGATEVATVVDGGGRYLIPGLWDMHVHALWDNEVARTFLPLFVANGVTGIRDMGGLLDVRDSVMRAIHDSSLTAPRIAAAGPILDGPEPVSPEVSVAIADPGEARRAVDSLARRNVDFIKVYTLLPPEAFRAAMAAARDRGLPVAGHLPAGVSPLEAAELGMRSIEHLRDEIAPFCTPRTAAACDTIFAAFARGHVWQTPTMVILYNKTHPEDDSRRQETRLRYMPDLVRRDWKGALAARLRADSATRLARIERFEDERWLVGAMARHGVPLLAGTDAGVLYSMPGFSLHDELALLVAAGLTPAQALATSTLQVGSYFGGDTLGVIRTGAVADLLLLEENPLEDITSTSRIGAVVLRGHLYTRQDLDAMLSAQER